MVGLASHQDHKDFPRPLKLRFFSSIAFELRLFNRGKNSDLLPLARTEMDESAEKTT